MDLVRAELINAGIPCELRENGMGDGFAPNSSDVELWIQNDGDGHRDDTACCRRREDRGRAAARRQRREIADQEKDLEALELCV